MADEVLTPQKLLDASADCETIEVVTNGDDQTDVTSRLGQTMPTIAKALRIILQMGINYYPTQIALLASTPLAGTKAGKALDTKKLFLWENGAWVDTGLSELDLSKNYTDDTAASLSALIESIAKQLRSSFFINPSSVNIAEFSDVDGDIVALIDKNSDLFLTGLTQSVQSILKDALSTKDSIYVSSDNENTIVFSDKDGDIIARIDLDSKLYLVGLDTDLVTYIKNNAGGDVIQDTLLAETRGYKDTFTSETQSLLNSLQYAQTGLKAPTPLHLFKHNFTTNKTWINDINQITFANSTRLEIDSPYRDDDGICHPNILEFWNGCFGYRYIVCMTPYNNSNEAEENPCIYGTQDLISFDLLGGFDQPLDVRPQPAYSTGHNSDNVLVYDPKTGELICIWRQTLRNPNNDGVRTDALWMRKTKDGKTWTNKERIFLNTKNTESGGAGSPAILYDAKSDYWYMYVTRLGPNSTDLRLFRAKKLNEDAWEYVSQITTPFVPWHQEVKFVGDKVVMLVYCYPPDNKLYFGIADDFQNFTWSENKYGETSCYKSSFVPEINDQNQLSLKILYSTDAQPPATTEKWRMYMHQTNFINVDLEII